MKTTVILWRHGQTDFNVQGRFQGQSDIPLNEVGQQQAADAAARLADFAPELIVSSDLVRAAVTADHLAQRLELPVARDPRLRETAFGEWEGHSRDEIAQRWPTELHEWLSGADIAPPGGESRSESGARVATAITEIVASAEASVIAIVAHGAVLRGASEVLLGMTGAGRLSVLGNCGHGILRSISEESSPRSWVLHSWGTGHSL